MRTPISKRLRFSIFARDQFTCAYCGKSPPEVKLVVDHIIPVIEEGTNDEFNLVTSCEDCNQGKGKHPLPNGENINDQKRRYQEMLERIDIAELAEKAIKNQLALRQNVCDYYCGVTGKSTILNTSLSALCNLVNEFGIESILYWIDIAVGKLGASEYCSNHIRYICGIAKNERDKI